MIGERVCAADLNSARRGRAFEEWLARRIRAGALDPDAAGWIGALFPGERAASAIAEVVGEAGEKCDLLARVCSLDEEGARRMRRIRWSAKMRSEGTGEGRWSHLQRLSPAKALAFGIAREGEDGSSLLPWARGEMRLESLDRALRERAIARLEPGWDALVERMLFGEGSLAADGMLCATAREEGGALFCGEVAALGKEEALRRVRALRTSLSYSPSWGGSLCDGVVSLRASGSHQEGLQAKINLAAALGYRS